LLFCNCKMVLFAEFNRFFSLFSTLSFEIVYMGAPVIRFFAAYH